jgi:hypothetical protein
VLPKLAVSRTGARARFCRRSAQLIRTEPDGPVPPCMTDSPAPLLIRANATQANRAGRRRMSRTRLKTAGRRFDPRPCPPHQAGQWPVRGLLRSGVLRIEGIIKPSPSPAGWRVWSWGIEEVGWVRGWRGSSCSVSSPSPSNRACGSLAHGSPTSFTGGVRRSPPGPVRPGSDDGSVEGNQPQAVGRAVDLGEAP